MTTPLKIGIIREGKVPPDKRVALTPEQCKHLKSAYPLLDIIVQPSLSRAFPDEDYRKAGIEVAEKMEKCDLLMGIKEVPVDQLIPDKTYFFFSHTIKKQPHNRKLLQEMLRLNIRMVDYETLTHPSGYRILAFGRYAGIVGCYNAFRGYGEKYGSFRLKPAHTCFDRQEMEEELKKVILPPTYKIVVTGSGRVGGGCLEILNRIGLRQVLPAELLHQDFNEPVFTVLHVSDYNKTLDGSAFDKQKFYADPSEFEPDFLKYARVADMYIPCHFWNTGAPQILTAADYRDPRFRIRLIADISCDIHEPIASTLRPSTIAEPFYGYDPITGKEGDFYKPAHIGVMAVDNLPCELPRDASRDFGKMLSDKIVPCLIGEDPDQIIERATLCRDGKLMPAFRYLEEYVKGKG